MSKDIKLQFGAGRVLRLDPSRMAAPGTSVPHAAAVMRACFKAYALREQAVGSMRSAISIFLFGAVAGVAGVMPWEGVVFTWFVGLFVFAIAYTNYSVASDKAAAAVRGEADDDA